MTDAAWFQKRLYERSVELGVCRDKNLELTEELQDLRREYQRLTANMAGAASAYNEYARRHASVAPKARTDPFFTTRVRDMIAAVSYARTIIAEWDE